MSAKADRTMQELLTVADDGRRLTVEQFVAEYGHAPNHELINGRVVVAPAGLYHDNVALKIGSLIQVFLAKNDVGLAYGSSAGFRLNEHTVVSPDASFAAYNKLPNRDSPDGYGEFAPDLAVEVVSPFDRDVDTEEKVQLYLAHGSKLVWVIYPRLKTATIYPADGAIRRIGADDVLDGEDALPGFSCRLAEVL
jgi:Uma2 family endonuclease